MYHPFRVLSSRLKHTMTNMINVKKTRISMVKPAKKTPQRALWMSSLDMLTPIPGHYPLFYMYRPPSSSPRTNPNIMLNATVLKEALSKVLVQFYPVAGRFRHDHNGRLEINCNGEGVLFVEAKTGAVVDDLGDFKPTPELHEALVPTVDCSGGISSFPLLAVQVTYFQCGGVSLVVHIDHHIGDGFSMFHFVNSWSRTARGLDITIQPFLDRKLLYRNPPQLVVNHKIEYPPLQKTKGSQQDSNSQQFGGDSITSAIFEINKEQLNILKKKSIHKDGNAIKYTTFQILASHIWKCGCIAREISDDQESKLYYAVTGRNSRLTPQLPLSYFGNVVFRAISISRAGYIKSKPIWYAANCVRKALTRMDNGYLRSTIDYLELHPNIEALSFGPHLHMSPNFYIISWVGLPAHDADFGWGQPFYMGPIEIEEGSAYIFCDSANEGSLRVAIALKSLHMKVFKELFLKECK